jgi:hypothetical protein
MTPLHFFSQLPPEVFQTILNFSDMKTEKTLKLVDKYCKTVVDTPRTALSADRKAFQAFIEFRGEQAKYEYQYGEFLKLGNSSWRAYVASFSWMPSFITKNFSIPKETSDLLTAKKNVCDDLQANISKIKRDLPIMKLFGGRKGFEELPVLPNRTDALAISIDDMTAPIMRYCPDQLNCDVFAIRMRDDSTEQYLFQPYLRASTGQWIVIESYKMERAPIGRRAIETDRTSLTKEELTNAFYHPDHCPTVVTATGLALLPYRELQSLVVHKAFTCFHVSVDGIIMVHTTKTKASFVVE